MPLCEICGMESQELHTCKECGATFCVECGETRHMLCYDCLGWTDEKLEEGDEFEEEPH
jgi:hypothetical protein